MAIKLRDLIRSVRACKTAADERALITKESALIRTAFKEEQNEYRHRNVAKLLYIHMLGYPTHFGQMEAIKLIASRRYAEKRIGYLALMLLLDERQEVLTLVTNSLQMDLESERPFVVGLALTAIGNIASAELSRDLANHVDRHLKSSNAYVRKKAALATIRMLRKVPDLIDVFLPHIVVLLTDKNHNVILTGTTLVTSIIDIDRSYHEKFTRLVPALVKILRRLLMAGYAPEYDVGGVTDPFLQARLLYLLRVIGAGSAAASESMNNILAQVATTTEQNKNAGNAVLYECVNTIMSVDSESALRVLAVNILGKFLGSKDPNIKYVALQTLVKVIHLDVAAVQRHRNIIVECLRDGDISIRRRALELVYALVDHDNVKQLTKEMLTYLGAADAETKPDLCVKISAVAERFSPSVRWRIDTLIAMLHTAGNYAKREVVSQAIFLITHATDLHSAMTHKLFAMALSTVAGSAEAQQAFLQVAVWTIGEYGELLLQPPPKLADDVAHPAGDVRAEADIVKLLDRTLHLYYGNVDTKAMTLTALLKLTVRLSDASQQSRVRKLIAAFQVAPDIELQQRSVEYGLIADPGAVSALEGRRGELLSPMPLLKEEVLRARAGAGTGEASDAHALAGEDVAMNVQERTLPKPDHRSEAAVSAPRHAANLLDLDSLFQTVTNTAGDLMSDEPTPTPTARATHGVSPTPPPVTSSLDDIFAGSGNHAPAAGSAASAATTAAISALANLDALFGTSGGGAPPAGNGFASLPSVHPAAPAANTLTSPGFAIPPSGSQAPMGASISDLFAATPAQQATPLPYMFTAHSSPDGLHIGMKCDKPFGPSNSLTDITVTFVNKGTQAITNFVCQAAVPKSMKLTMLPASGMTLEPHSSGGITQVIKVDNSQQGAKPIALKLKLVYSIAGQSEQATEMIDVKSFPPTL